MKDKIVRYLHNIERERKIKILFACESGSHAWGFAAPESDYDIRAIYIHEKDWYLSINKKRDIIEMTLENGLIDIVAMDLRKSLKLLRKSHPLAFEQINSNVVYINQNETQEQLQSIVEGKYSRRSALEYYLRRGQEVYDEIAGDDECSMMKVMHLGRNTMACQWILNEANPIPINIRKLKNHPGIPSEINQLTDYIIDLRSQGKGKCDIERHGVLINYAKQVFDEANQKVDSIPHTKMGKGKLNKYFRTTLNSNS